MKAFFSKMRGDSATCPPRPRLELIVISWIGGVVATAIVAYLTDISHFPLILGSFGASCVLLFGFPESPFSQPRNVIVGHFLSSSVGLIFFVTFGAVWWSIALAVGTAIAVMQFTRTVHPPAGSNPVIVMLTAPTWVFLFTPTLFGAIILVVVAIFLNNLVNNRYYPTYWI